jgi:hypothetical protein
MPRIEVEGERGVVPARGGGVTAIEFSADPGEIRAPADWLGSTSRGSSGSCPTRTG